MHSSERGARCACPANPAARLPLTVLINKFGASPIPRYQPPNLDAPQNSFLPAGAPAWPLRAPTRCPMRWTCWHGGSAGSTCRQGQHVA